MLDHGNITWQLVPLDYRRIKRVQNHNLIILGSIREIGPVEPVGMVVLLLNALEHCFGRIIIVALVKVYSVTVYGLPQLDHCLH